MADEQILQAIRIIDDKIASLQAARNQLANAFGIGNNPFSPSTHPSIAVPHLTAPASKPQPISEQQPKTPGGRKVQLAEFLFASGPMSRVAIVEKSGLPEGTVSYCLNDKRFFVQAANGDWDINDFSRKGLEMKDQSGTGVYAGQH
jgi:hypothetical protein